jgi:hypothetical protein
LYGGAQFGGERLAYSGVMSDSWTMAVARDDLRRTTLVQHDVPEPAEGEVVLRVDRVGLTANNVTYAVLGDDFRYWEFFPPGPRGLGDEWGLVPLWGFSEVAESRVSGVEVGQRYYGYLPSGGHLLVRPGRVDARGFREGSEHRVDLPSPYNAYVLTSADPAYQADQEDLLAIFRPLFFTSYMLADHLADQEYYGAKALVFSSASSKTAYATAFELRGRGPRLIGLTSAGNVGFTWELDCYDEVLSYDEIAALDPDSSYAYVDLSGTPGTRAAIRERLGAGLVRDIAVGLTHQVPNVTQAGEFFFAPVQMRKRSTDWGRETLDARFAEAWQRFSGFARAQIDLDLGHGPQALQAAWLETVEGRTPPRTGHIVVC